MGAMLLVTIGEQRYRAHGARQRDTGGWITGDSRGDLVPLDRACMAPQQSRRHQQETGDQQPPQQRQLRPPGHWR